MNTKTEQYVTNYYELAKKAGERYKIDPLIILSQGAFESTWGTSTLATKHNNFFGITASGAVNEFWKGAAIQTNTKYQLKFRVYATAQDSFYDFARLIWSKYKSAHAAGDDYKLFAQKIANSPYISEKNGDNRTSYMNGIIAIYQNIWEIAKKKISSFREESASEQLS